jgi:hypothetical protein
VQRLQETVDARRDNRRQIARPRAVDSSAVFAVIFVSIFLLHLPLLQLPYFWDEAGYYVPAARDIFLTGSLIPHSTVSNAHPPLVLAWLALWWKVVGDAPLVTRSAMLVIAAFSLLGVFRLAERVANREVAIASTVCTALYPVFFAQSSLAQIDLAAAGFTFWGIAAYINEEVVATAFWFALAGLAKETAILAPAALAAWEMAGVIGRRSSLRWLWRETGDSNRKAGSNVVRIAPLLVSVLPLALWYAYHYSRTGYVFGNPEFFRYNVASTMNLTRFLLALGLRIWQVVGYLHLWILTLAAMIAMLTLGARDDFGRTRQRIGIAEQMIFAVVIVTYVVAMALVGGAVLARYMLPAVPLVIILCVATLWRRVGYWRALIALVTVAFIAAWFWNPPYGFAPEDNLAYRDYVLLHEDGERFLEARYPMAQVLTAWPASDEISRPWLGYITRPMRVVRIEDFSLDNVILATESESNYDVALVFSTKYEPPAALWDRWRSFTELRTKWKTRFFGYHRDLPPAVAANILGGRIVFSEERHGQWITVIEIERLEEARKFTLDSANRGQ